METIIMGYIGIVGVILGLYWIMEKKMEITIMENQMENNMENEMETGIIMGYRAYIGC